MKGRRERGKGGEEKGEGGGEKEEREEERKERKEERKERKEEREVENPLCHCHFIHLVSCIHHSCTQNAIRVHCCCYDDTMQRPAS